MAHKAQELTQQTRGQNHPQHHRSQPEAFKYPGVLTGALAVWLQEQTHSGCASIVLLPARLVLPWSNLLPDELPHTCMDLIKQRSHLADGSGFSYSTVSSLHGQHAPPLGCDTEKPKQWWLPKQDHALSSTAGPCQIHHLAV